MLFIPESKRVDWLFKRKSSRKDSIRFMVQCHGKQGQYCVNGRKQQKNVIEYDA